MSSSEARGHQFDARRTRSEDVHRLAGGLQRQCPFTLAGVDKREIQQRNAEEVVATIEPQSGSQAS